MRRDWNVHYKRGFDYGYTVGREDERNEHRDDSDRMTRRINELQAQVTDLNARLADSIKRGDHLGGDDD